MVSSAASSLWSMSLDLALAALFGSSLMAISAFFLHRRSVDLLLQRIILLREKEGDGEEVSETEEEADQGFEIEDETILLSRMRVDYDAPPVGFRIASSLPNRVFSAAHWFENDEEKMDGAGGTLQEGFSFGGHDSIPPGLPQLRTALGSGSNEHVNHSSSTTTLASIGRSPPKSLVMEGSSEQCPPANENNNKFRYGQDNGNFASVGFMSISDAVANKQDSAVASFEVTNVKSSQDQQCKALPGRSHGAKILHGSQMVEPVVDTLRKDPHDVLVPFKTTPNAPPSKEEEEVCIMLQECLALREKYVYREKLAPWLNERTKELNEPKPHQDPFHFDPVESTEHYFRMEDGVVHVYENKDASEDLFPTASSTRFFTDMHHVLRVISQGNVRTVCHHRLRFLEEKFRLHLLMNSDLEFLAQKSAPHRDFYNVRKVDTHVHHSACMNQKQLLRFIKLKLRKEPDEVVIFRDGKYLTLKEVFESLDLTGYDLNVDLLDVHADKNTFHRFDRFNLKYNPCGQSRLREIFLKQDNLIQGRFLGEVTKQVLSDLEASKYQMAEYRVSIYGRKQSEWDQLASWFINNTIYSENAIWLIQLPRLYNIYKKMGIVTSFQNILDNVFIPLFEVTIDPNSHPQLHVFLSQVVGFDIVDDESKPERRPTKHMPKPAEWTNEFNPAYSYYAFYCYANLYSLNKLRESKGMTTIRFRPHCGEAGDTDHLAAAFLLCHNIAHGINLRKSPVLQYLYYLTQIGLSMSPLSNNSLFVDYHRNPFPMFFQRGLNVSLSSDDPLLLHLTKEPLVEEYSVAAQVWKLSSCDLCEIARNSVYQSGFSHAAKSHWLGGKYYKRGPEGNDIQQTNVPHLRIAFRHETWKEEMQFVYAGKAKFPGEVDR